MRKIRTVYLKTPTELTELAIISSMPIEDKYRDFYCNLLTCALDGCMEHASGIQHGGISACITESCMDNHVMREFIPHEFIAAMMNELIGIGNYLSEHIHLNKLTSCVYRITNVNLEYVTITEYGE